MAPTRRYWSEVERKALVRHLLQGCHRVDMNSVATIGYFVLAVQADLSRTFATRITREDVVEEILSLKNRYDNFRIFIAQHGLQYNEVEDKMVVTPEYFSLRQEEPWMAAYRKKGEPLFKQLKCIFLHGRGEVADWPWLLAAFRLGGSLWLSEGEPQRLFKRGSSVGVGPVEDVFPRGVRKNQSHCYPN